MNDVLNRYYNIIFLVVIIFYNLVPKKVRPIYLLLSSLFMFFIMSKWLIVFLLISIISVYFSAIFMEKLDARKKDKLKEATEDDKKTIKEKFKKKKKLVLLLCLLINISFLFVFKYLKFFTINTNTLLSLFKIDYSFNILKLISPIGISFYTLQMLSYLFDVYNGKISADHNFTRLSLFGSFFPCIMEGPICRYSDTADKIYECNKITYYNLCYGLQRILWGLFKKIVIADRLNILVKTVFNAPSLYNGTTIFIAAVSYTIMLYMDFSGAMDVVVGTGNIFGFSIPENFKQPFFSKNIIRRTLIRRNRRNRRHYHRRSLHHRNCTNIHRFRQRNLVRHHRIRRNRPRHRSHRLVAVPVSVLRIHRHASNVLRTRHTFYVSRGHSVLHWLR